MNRIVAPTEGQPIEAPAPAAKITVLNPVGYPPKITRKSAAPRLESLDGKTVYLVDCRFDDSIELLKQVQAWFAEHMPGVTTKFVSLSAYYGHDDPKTWEEIKANGDAAIIGVGHCSTCAPAVAMHAITLDTKYGVPTVALHTDKFDKVVRVGRRKMAGLPEAPTVFVPQPVMGKSADELRAYVDGNDPVTGRPVMQEIVEALTSAAETPRMRHRGRGRRRGWSSPTPKTTSSSCSSRTTGPTSCRSSCRPRSAWRRCSRTPATRPTRSSAACSRPQIRGLWEYTVEKVAVNAVMAGARPEYFPVILALAATEVSARAQHSSSVGDDGRGQRPDPPRDRHELRHRRAWVRTTTPTPRSAAPTACCRRTCRAARCRARPIMGSQGNNYTYNNITFAENEERSPWEPLHVQNGFKATDSVVSVFCGCRSTTFSLGLREKYWREHVRDMLPGSTRTRAVPAARSDHRAAVHRPRRLRHQGEADPLAARDGARCRPGATGICSWCRTTSIPGRRSARSRRRRCSRPPTTS